MSRRPTGSGVLRSKPIRGGKTMYYADYYDAHGERRRPSLSTDKRVAQRMFIKLINDRDRAACGLTEENLQDRRLRDIQELYVRHLTVSQAPSYVKNLRPRLDRVLAAVGDVRVRDLDSEALMRFRDRRIEDGPLSKRRPSRPQTIANRTVNMDINSLKGMLNWAVQEKLIAINPIGGFSILSQGDQDRVHLRRALTSREVTIVLSAAETIDRRKADRKAAKKSIDGGTRGRRYAERKRPPYVPQAPLWRALIFTGARWGELTRTVWSDVDPQRKTILLRAKVTKNGRARRIPLDGRVIRDIKVMRRIQTELLGREPRSDEEIFLSPRGRPQSKAGSNARTRLLEVLAEARIDREDEMGRVIDIHALRYTFASMLAAAGVPLVMAQKLLGHSDPKLTAGLYTDLGVDELRVAIELLEAYRQEVGSSTGQQDEELDLGAVWALDVDEDRVREALAKYETRRSA